MSWPPRVWPPQGWYDWLEDERARTPNPAPADDHRVACLVHARRALEAELDRALRRRAAQTAMSNAYRRLGALQQQGVPTIDVYRDGVGEPGLARDERQPCDPALAAEFEQARRQYAPAAMLYHGVGEPTEEPEEVLRARKEGRS